MFEKLEKQTLSGRVYAKLEAMITNGEWEIGSRIPREADLMEKLGVSRNTLREAIRGLVQVGLLETRQGDGTFVTASSELSAILAKRMSRSSVIEALEVQHALDREAAVLACLRRTDEQLRQMEQYSKQCSETIERNDHEAYREADWMLHRTIVVASHNQLLIDLYENMFEKLQISFLFNRFIPESRSEVGHPALIAAIRDRDAEAAVHAVDHYIALFKSPHEQADSSASPNLSGNGE
ncbi:FadR/GntR family transcriptional regulator [Saccharibacillus sacchari]|uniref:FadR/GntR family transcriptional regulator n=1 Tax=Saccharibacillus sacchari TaxID=456493 RepID=A0ACC6PAH9_9BACL